jgi:hypothetical protein
MPYDWSQIVGVLIVLFGGAFLYLHLRYDPRATKEVKTGADLQARFGRSPYTLVQLFAPM